MGRVPAGGARGAVAGCPVPAYRRGMGLDRRQRWYFLLRGGAALVFLGSAALLPRGVPSALLCMAAGLAAVLTCVGVNAGGRGEQAGARPQNRHFDGARAPQGDWPPYQVERVVEGETVPGDR